MANQDYSISPTDFWNARRGRLSLYRRTGMVSPEVMKEIDDNTRRMEAAQKKAVQMLRKSNAGKRRRHSVKYVVDFLESLPERVEAEVEFFGDDLTRNIYTRGEDLYSLSNIVITRVFNTKILGWKYSLNDDGGGWQINHGIIFARNDEKRMAQLRLLDDVFTRYVETPDCANGDNITDKQVRDALAIYECKHGDGFEPVFYRRSEDGELYLRDYMCPYEDEERYFEDMEPLDREEAFEQFWKSDWSVYEEYDE